MRKKNHFVFTFLLFLFQVNYLFSLVKNDGSHENDDPHFVIIIPSYNNKMWYKRNLDSVLNQDYKKYRVIYIDDCSPDGTGRLVQQYIAENDTDNKVTLIKNKERQWALANWYFGIHSCADNEIIVNLDGDDWLAHEQVLSFLARIYRDSAIWLTYGQYICLGGKKKGCCQRIESQVIKQNLYRKKPWVTSHLRTFYAWLFKAIKLEDFLYQGAFFPMTGDLAFMFPMLEMSGGRFKFIPDILYIYNTDNPLNDKKIDKRFHVYLGKFIREKKSYQPLKKPIITASEKAVSCSLTVIANNDDFHVQQIREQLPKQQSIISSVKILDKKNCQQFLKDQLFLEQSMLTEFVMIATQDNLVNIWPKLDDAISLLQQTQASVCTFIETENAQIKEQDQGKSKEKNKRRIIGKAHCSLLSKSAYAYQLGWKPDISTNYHECAYIFSLNFLREHAEQLPDLLDDHFQLSKNFKQLFAHYAGLLIS